MEGTSVSDIHCYPLKPPGFEGPLFPTADSKRTVAEHLLKAPWLTRASELKGRSGEAAHALEEPVELKNSHGRVEVIRPRGSKTCSWRRGQVVEVLDRWREIESWWDEDLGVDRMVFRTLLSCGAVVDLARERSGWLLVGVVD